jgi:hypothetical protein
MPGSEKTAAAGIEVGVSDESPAFLHLSGFPPQYGGFNFELCTL